MPDCVVSVCLMGEPVLGVWCPRCVLPSAVEFSIGFVRDGLPFGVATLARCLDCEENVDVGS